MKKLRLVPVSGDPIEITKDQVLIGRDPACEVVLPDGSVSRRHAKIEWRGDVWAVLDQASANGTFIDSQRVAEAGLRSGQELRFGAVPFIVEIEGEEEDLSATVSTAALAGATVMAPSPIVPPPAPVAPPKPPTPAPPRPAPPAAAPPRPPSPPRPAAPPPPPLPMDQRPTGKIPPQPRIAAALPPAGPPMGAGPQPPRKGRSPAFWIATGCCGCLGLVLVAVGLGLGWAFWVNKGAADIVKQQLQEIRQGQLDVAYSRLSSNYRSRLSPEAFAAFVERHPALKDNADSTFLSRNVVNDTARLSGVLVSSAGVREEVIYELVKEGDGWKISSIRFSGEPPGDLSGGSGGEGSPEAGGLEIQTSDVGQVPDPAGAGTRVTVKIRVSGFATRPDEGAFRIDLAQDLETLGPDGARIAALSKRDFFRLSRTIAGSEGHFADFETNLTLPPGSDGTYTCRLTIRDLIGGTRKTHEVPFDL